MKEQGQTKVLLTADSNLIEVHELKKVYEKTVSHYPGRGRGRGRGRDTLTRFYEREDRLLGGAVHNTTDAQQNQLENRHGEGWFMWRDWRVEERFMENFNKHIEKLVDKHRAAIERERSRVDNRIAALLKEKEINGDPGLQRIIDFFAEVFVKYLYMKTNFSNLSVDQIINTLRVSFSQENTEFAHSIKLVMQQQQQQQQESSQHPGGQRAAQLPDSVRQEMARAALGRQHYPQPQSPSQPLNLSLAATDVPLPPSPTSPAPGDDSYPNLPSVQSINPGTPIRHSNTIPIPKV